MGSPPWTHSTVTPGDGLLHPVVVASLGVLILNDHVFKALWPGVLTGKLSDVAGLIVAPLAMQAAWEVGRSVRGGWTGPPGSVLGRAIALVGIGFVAIQVWQPAIDAYRIGLGVLQWPFAVFASVVSGGAIPGVVPVVSTPDGTDLFALPALAVAYWIGRRRSDRDVGEGVVGR